MNYLSKIALVCAAIAFVTPAAATPFNNFEDQVVSARFHRGGTFQSGVYRGGLGPKPSRWCGWYMRSIKGGGPEYNLAANWLHYGRPSGPQVGAIVVWNTRGHHHVGLITGRTAQGWVVKSGNDGGRVRERVRSVAGASFRI